MKNIKVFFVLVLCSINLASFAQSKVSANEALLSDKIEAYYFHFNARCVTCKAVENEAKKDIEALYPELIKQGKISFQSINLDEATSKSKVDKLKISGQTLILVKGNKKVNITNDGFLYARSNPEKFRSIIKEKVDQLLKVE